jgi:hypothetical protein
VAVVALAVLSLGGCQGRGRVGFIVDQPQNALLNPFRERITDYSLKRADGSVVAVVSEQSGRTSDLLLGALPLSEAPVDLELLVSAGPLQVGQARMKDVVFQSKGESTYTAAVRKPLLVIGGSRAPEGDGPLEPAQWIDTVSQRDLVYDSMGSASPLTLPSGVTASAFSWDGRFLFAATGQGLHVIDTGTGREVGVATLGFDASRIAVAARDTSVAVLSADPSLPMAAIFRDVAALANSPATAVSVMLTLPMQSPRRLVYSKDGGRLFILDGGQLADPCSAQVKPQANRIVVIDALGGGSIGEWQLPGFVSDFALDPESGALVLSDSTRGQVLLLDEQTEPGPVQPRSLGPVVCPSAIGVARGAALVVTSEFDPEFGDGSFVLAKVPLTSDGTGNAIEQLPFSAPRYAVTLADPDKPNPRISPDIVFLPVGLVATELALSPDGERAVLATRTLYRETNSKFAVLDYSCTADYDVVEYGTFLVDTGSGNSSYSMRSQWVTRAKRVPISSNVAEQYCALCATSFLDELYVLCSNEVGDRATGLSASFGGR